MVFVLFCVLFLLLCCPFPIFVQVYRLLPPAGNLIDVNIIYPIISYHISYHIISYHIISYHIISYHIISYHIISYHIISYHTWFGNEDKCRKILSLRPLLQADFLVEFFGKLLLLADCDRVFIVIVTFNDHQ